MFRKRRKRSLPSVIGLDHIFSEPTFLQENADPITYDIIDISAKPEDNNDDDDLEVCYQSVNISC